MTSSVNRAKSDSGPEEWRPPDASYWCQYAIDWAAIKADWGLSATPAEWDALLEMAATCGGDVPPTPTPPPTATLAPGATTYPSCDAAEAAGAYLRSWGGPSSVETETTAVRHGNEIRCSETD